MLCQRAYPELAVRYLGYPSLCLPPWDSMFGHYLQQGLHSVCLALRVILRSLLWVFGLSFPDVVFLFFLVWLSLIRDHDTLISSLYSFLRHLSTVSSFLVVLNRLALPAEKLVTGIWHPSGVPMSDSDDSVEGGIVARIHL